MKITYLGIRQNQFRYLVELNGHTFDYSTGLGWVRFEGKKPEGCAALRQDEIEIVTQSSAAYRRPQFGENVWRKAPSEGDILECLQGDVEAGQMSFNEFCDTFGYDNDSLKALDVYRACMETARKLRGFVFPQKNEDK